MTYEQAYKIAADWAMYAHTEHNEKNHHNCAGRLQKTIGIDFSIACEILYGPRERRNNINLQVLDPLAIIAVLIPTFYRWSYHMNKHVPSFGTDATFEELAERIRGFSHDDASVTEQGKMVAACKLLAEETVNRWETVRTLERKLREKVSMAELREQMREVLAVDAPRRTMLSFRWPR